jgi:hypothetical protein
MLRLNVQITGDSEVEIAEALRDVLWCVESGEQQGASKDEHGSCRFEVVTETEPAQVG